MSGLSLLVQTPSVYWSVAGVRPVSPCPNPRLSIGVWLVSGLSLLVQIPVCLLECGWCQACLSLSKPRLYIGVWLVSGLSLLVQIPVCLLECGWCQACLSLSKPRLYIGVWLVSGLSLLVQNPSVYWSVAGVRPVSPCPNPLCILECGWCQACLSLSKPRLYIGVWLVSGLSLLVQTPYVYWSVAGVRPVSPCPNPVCILECGWRQAYLSLSKTRLYIGVWLVSGLSLLVQIPVCLLECGWCQACLSLSKSPSVYWSVAGVRPVSPCPKPVCILECGWCQACLSLSKTRLYIGVWLVSGLSLLVQTPYVYWSVAGVRPVSPCPKPVCILECGWCQACLSLSKPPMYIGVWLVSGLSLLVQNPSVYWSVAGIRPVSPCPNPVCILECGWYQACLSLSKTRLYIGVWLVSGLSLLVQNPSVYWSVAGVRPVSPCPNPLCILECGWCQACLSLSNPRLYIGVWLVSGLSLLVQNPSVYWSVAGGCLSWSKTCLFIGVWLVSGLSLFVQKPSVYWGVAGVRPASSSLSLWVLYLIVLESPFIYNHFI